MTEVPHSLFKWQRSSRSLMLSRHFFEENKEAGAILCALLRPWVSLCIGSWIRYGKCTTSDDTSLRNAFPLFLSAAAWFWFWKSVFIEFFPVTWWAYAVWCMPVYWAIVKLCALLFRMGGPQFEPNIAFSKANAPTFAVSFPGGRRGCVLV